MVYYSSMTMKHKKKINKQGNNNGIRQEIRNVGVLVERLDGKISLVAEQYGDIKQSLNQHTEMIGSMKMDTEIMKTNIEFIKNSMKQKVDVGGFSALERRAALLESGR